MDSRLLIAVILSLAAVFAYQEFVLKRLYPPQEETTTSASRISPSASPSLSASPIPHAFATQTAPVELPSAPKVPPRTIEVDTDTFIAKLSTDGGRLTSFRLRKYRETAVRNSPLLELVTPGEGTQLPLGLVVHTSRGVLSDHNVTYQTDAPARVVLHDNQHATLKFLAALPDGLKVAKELDFNAHGYVFDMGATVTGPPGEIKAVGLNISESLKAHQGYYDIPQIQALVAGKSHVEAEKALRKHPKPLEGKITYAGFGDRYFLTVFLPVSPREGSVAMAFNGVEATASMMFSPPPSNGTMRIATQVYMGPKELTTLEKVNPDLSRAIDFGWSGILALAFLRALKLFHYISPNYGVDIILLTVAIRILFLPMSIKSQRSMMRLQRLQPQVEKLREKFKDDRDRLNREMVDLYKRNHVNPLGGCAPMLLQLPIFIGLYEALLNAVELRHAPFIGWIRDLSAPECLPIPHFPHLSFLPCAGIPVLVILMGVSTFFQQKMSPQSPDPNQQKMMMLMPLVFTVMFLNFPAGLTLYYFCSNILGIAQQIFLNREFKQLGPANA